MKDHSRRPRHFWLIALVAGALVAGHAVALFLFASYFTTAAAVASFVVLLVILKHVGLVGGAYGWLRRRRRRASDHGTSESRSRTRLGA